MKTKFFALILMTALVLTAFCAAPVAAEATNLIPNGSFESVDTASGLPVGYTSNNTTTLVTSGGQDGSNYLTMPNTTDTLYIVVPVEEHSNYLLSFWTKTSVNNSIRLRCYQFCPGWTERNTYCSTNNIPYIPGEGDAEVKISPNTVAGTYYDPTSVLGTTDWTKQSLEIIVPAATTHLQIIFDANSITDAGRGLDNISLVKKAYNLVANGNFECRIGTVDMGNWAFHPGDTYNGHFGWASNEGNNYPVFTSSSSEYGGVYPYQYLALQPGHYKLRFKKMLITGQQYYINLRNAATNSGADTTLGGNHVPMNSFYWFGQGYGTTGDLATNVWRYYTCYFDVKVAARYKLELGSIYCLGSYSVDDVEILPIRGEVEYYNNSITTFQKDANGNITYYPDSKNDYGFATSIAAGGTVEAMGVYVPETTYQIETFTMVTGIYKYRNGIAKLHQVVLTNGTNEVAGKMGFAKSGAITVPASNETETYQLRSFIVDSIGNIKPMNPQTDILN